MVTTVTATTIAAGKPNITERVIHLQNGRHAKIREDHKTELLQIKHLQEQQD